MLSTCDQNAESIGWQGRTVSFLCCSTSNKARNACKFDLPYFPNIEGSDHILRFFFVVVKVLSGDK